MSQQNRNTPFLLLLGIGIVWAVLLVVGSSHKKATPETQTQNQTQTQVQTETAVQAEAQAQTQATATHPTQTASASAPAPAPAPVSCWQAQFALQSSRLNRIQKESLGARNHRIHLAEIIEKFTLTSKQGRYCVRSQGHALAFERDTKDSSVLVVRGGTGRIHEKSRLEVEYCAEGQKCAPCQVRKDSFEEALLGENADDSKANEDEDVTSQLSTEVRRELARMEEQGKPAAIDAWEVVNSQARCGQRS